MSEAFVSEVLETQQTAGLDAEILSVKVGGHW